MFANADITAVAIGLGSFAFFLLVHFLLFRVIGSEQIFKGLIFNFIAGLVLFLFWSALVFEELSSRVVLVLFGAFAIYALSCFVYVLCVFGPYETSIRMRLIRELSCAKEGLSLSALLERYNTSIILDIRLRRLLGAKDLIEQSGRFYLQKKQNVFFAIDAIARRLHDFIHG